ncbi:Maltase 1 [Harpegnathos saltator]|uniref:alpha-glucosidase n=1 Tax=Harpegnathos saltator TaxID=610380 RepID=E2CA35_HARSA|nr:Maltase 1 [Harpegnathos saltator]
MVDFGYDISNFTDIDPIFGDLRDFKTLPARAKKLGLKAKGRGKNGKKPPNNWISVFSDSAWTYVNSQKQWYLHQFDYRQPDLNFYNPAVKEGLILSNHDNPRVASRFPGRSDHMTILSMNLPDLAVTYNGDEIGMVDKRDISWEDTKDPQTCNAGEKNYATVSRDPERTPFQWDATKNAGKIKRLVDHAILK